MDELKKSLEALGKAFEEFKVVNNQRITEIATKGSASALTEEKVAKASAAVDHLTQERDRLQKEIDGIKTAMARPGMGGGTEDEAKAQVKAHTEAFNKFARKGEHRLTAEEVKLLSTDSDPSGGMLVPTNRSSEIIMKVFESSPLAELASVETIGSGDSIDVLQDTDEVDAGWVGEEEDRDTATDNPEFGMVNIVCHEMKAMPKTTQRLLDDGAWDFEAWLQAKLQDKFSRTAATACISGNGVKKARGILTYPSGTGTGQIEQVNSGSAATVTADGLVNLQGALKEPYQKNATWLMKRATRTTIRTLKDGQGQYLWQPGLTAKEPDTILGNPVRLADDMTALGSNALSVAYGDFKQGYKIVRKLGMRTLRDNVTVKGFVLFYTTMRFGGGVQNFESIKIGKCSA